MQKALTITALWLRLVRYMGPFLKYILIALWFYIPVRTSLLCCDELYSVELLIGAPIRVAISILVGMLFIYYMQAVRLVVRGWKLYVYTSLLGASGVAVSVCCNYLRAFRTVDLVVSIIIALILVAPCRDDIINIYKDKYRVREFLYGVNFVKLPAVSFVDLAGVHFVYVAFMSLLLIVMTYVDKYMQ